MSGKQVSARAVSPPPERVESPAPVKVRLHFQKSVNMRVAHLLGQMSGHGTYDTDTGKILSKDQAGMLLDIEGKCGFIPWSNITWVECL